MAIKSEYLPGPESILYSPQPILFSSDILDFVQLFIIYLSSRNSARVQYEARDRTDPRPAPTQPIVRAAGDPHTVFI